MSHAEVNHAAADRANAVITNHANDLPIEQLDAVASYRDYLREQALNLEELSYRLREQARRVSRERQDSVHSCRVCCLPIQECSDGLCYLCRAEFVR